MSTLMQCAACGREISTNAAACPHCGEPSGQSQKSKQTATGCLAAILIGLLIGGVLYMLIAG